MIRDLIFSALIYFYWPQQNVLDQVNLGQSELFMVQQEQIT